MQYLIAKWSVISDDYHMKRRLNHKNLILFHCSRGVSVLTLRLPIKWCHHNSRTKTGANDCMFTVCNSPIICYLGDNYKPQLPIHVLVPDDGHRPKC